MLTYFIQSDTASTNGKPTKTANACSFSILSFSLGCVSRGEIVVCSQQRRNKLINFQMQIDDNLLMYMSRRRMHTQNRIVIQSFKNELSNHFPCSKKPPSVCIFILRFTLRGSNLRAKRQHYLLKVNLFEGVAPIA